MPRQKSGLILIVTALIGLFLLAHFIPVRSQTHSIDCKVPLAGPPRVYKYRVVLGQYSQYNLFSHQAHAVDCALLQGPNYVNLQEKDKLFIL